MSARLGMTQRADMRKIIFVCTGNTCRSPMAEGLFKKYLQERNINNIQVASAGLSAFFGDTVSQNAVIAAKELGVDISSHRAKLLNQYDFSYNTFFVCMTDEHKEALKRYADERKIYALNVVDPYGGNISVYNKCALEIKSNFDNIFNYFCLDLEIKKMDNNDIHALYQIEKDCFSTPWSEKSFSEELTNETSRFFTAIHNGNIIGYIGANNICGEIYITNIAVIQAFRRKGVAGELLTHLVDYSKNENAEFVTLEVRESNKIAISLYNQFEFENVGLRKDFYSNPNENAILMTKYFKNQNGETQ